MCPWAATPALASIGASHLGGMVRTARNGRTLRVLHLPTPTGGNAYGLAQGERALGLQSMVMYESQNWLAYPCDIALDLDRPLGRWQRHWLRARFFLDALARYDVFHLNFGTPFLSSAKRGIFGLDLPIYRMLGKKVVVTYNGCDGRLRRLCGADAFQPRGRPYCVCGSRIDDASKLRHFRWFRRYAHRIFAVNPDLCRCLPGAEFLPYTIYDFAKLRPAPLQPHSRPLRVLHAPTDRDVKGTRFVLDAVQRLRRERDDVELVLVERLPVPKARELYATADVVIDQLLLGWYGGLAVEVMALGKPVICYLRQDDLKYLNPAMRADVLATIIQATPDTIYDVLKQTIEDREQLPRLGEQARAYVERWHDPVKIAAYVRQVYESA
jgi:glycosyltransferase involved in cell wall biosynthesis